MENPAIWQLSERTHDMAFVVLCPVCERLHRRGTGWFFCRLPEYREIFAGLRSVQEREEAFWQSRTQYRSDEFPNAACLMLPSVMARLLDARADPNLCAPPLCCYAIDHALAQCPRVAGNAPVVQQRLACGPGGSRT